MLKSLEGLNGQCFLSGEGPSKAIGMGGVLSRPQLGGDHHGSISVHRTWSAAPELFPSYGNYFRKGKEGYRPADKPSIPKSALILL